MKIATWNVNSIKVRLPIVLDWLRAEQPDILLLQEIKTVEDGFPTFELTAEGYCCAVVGQATYNGVAIVSKRPLQLALRSLPGDDSDATARYVEAVTESGLRVASLYLPNGNPTGSDRFRYKLAWMERLRGHVRDLLGREQPFVLGGDYNVVPEDIDVHDPDAWRYDALCQPETRAAFRRIVYLGLTDAFRSINGDVRRYSWWDYRAGAWQRDEGLRIDHLMLSPQAADRLTACDIDKTPRGRDKASDHTPVWCVLEG